MPKDKNIVVGLELKDREFLRGLKEINESVQDIAKIVRTTTGSMGGNFATLASEMGSVKTAVGVSNRTLTELKNILIDIRTHMVTLNSKVGSVNTSLTTLNRTTSQSVTEIKGVKQSAEQASNEMQGYFSAVNQTNAAALTLNNTNNALANSFDDVQNAANTASMRGLQSAQNAYSKFSANANKTFGAMNKGGPIGDLIDLANPARIASAASWDFAYKVVNAPGRAVGALVSGVDKAIKSTAQLEGNLFDLEAYLGGPGGAEFAKLGAAMGGVGDDAQLQAKGMEVLQQKILAIGQESTFTANQIAEATIMAAKAGIQLDEIAGKEGTALDAISLLSQNTGESLESSAEQVAKLQALFESNLNRTQAELGQTASASRQYQLIVDGLASADQASAASAQQLTEALFNVGGSASNLNISFFETMSLVSQMVPAFESAASAGTSLKYVFSGISGGRSVKAKGAMQRFGLMDQYGQSVFFGKNAKTGETEFLGIEHMVEKLRAVFGEESGMAVDVRNRVITDIFGQDALKAVSRMVSMTDEQAQEMYKMASDMTSNAASGIQAAKNVAAIKNEGLEYDLEVLSGTMDSFQKTLTMPLMKPYSNIVQTFSQLLNASYLVMTEAENAESDAQKIKDSLTKTSLLPGIGGLIDTALAYARSLGSVLKIIQQDGYSISSISKALGTLFGGSQAEIAQKTQQFQDLLNRVYSGIQKFVAAVPNILETLAKFSLIAFDGLIRGMTWLIENWDTVVQGLKLVIAALVVQKVADFTSGLLGMGFALAEVAVEGRKAGGILANIADIAGENAGGFSQAIQWTATNLGIGTNAKAASAAATAAQAAATNAPLTTAAANSLPLIARLVAGWTTLTTAAGTFFSTVFTQAGLLSMLNGILTALTSTFALVVVAVVAVVAALALLWTNDVGGFATWIKKQFSEVAIYFQDFASIFVYEWNRIVNAFSWVKLNLGNFWTWMNENAKGNVALAAFGEIAKGIVMIFQNIWLFVGGTLKLILGLITFDVNLMGEALKDIGISIAGALGGVVRTFVGFVEAAIAPVVQFVDWVSKQLGGKELAFDWIEKAAEVGDMFDFGMSAANDVDKGYRKGLKNNTKGTASAVKTYLNDSTIETTNSLFEIHSPSRWAYNVATMIGAGFADGFTDVAPDIAASMASMLHMSMDAATREGFAQSADVLNSISLNAQKNIDLKNSNAVKDLESHIGKNTATSLGYEETSYLARSLAKDRGVGGEYRGRTIDWKTEVKPFSYAAVGTNVNYGPQSVGYNPYARKTGIQGTPIDGAQIPTTKLEEDAISTLLMSEKFNEWAKAVFGKNVKIDEKFVMDKITRYTTGGLFTADWQYGYGSKEAMSAHMNMVARYMGFENVDDWKKSADFVNANTLRRENSERTVALSREEAIKALNIPSFTTRAGMFGETITSTSFAKKQQKYIKDTAFSSAITAGLLSEVLEGQEQGVYFGKSQGLYAGEGEYRLTNYQQLNATGQKIGQWDNKVGAFVTSLKEYNDQVRANGTAYAAMFNAVRTEIVANMPENVDGSKPQQNVDDVNRYTQGAANVFGKVGLGVVETLIPKYSLPAGLAFERAGQVGATEYGSIETSYETRDVTPEEMKAKNKPLDFVPVSQLPQMASFFSDSIIPEAYDGENGMVSTDVAAFKTLYGEEGLAFQGVSKLFEKTPELASQYAQVGNRAATFLSLKQGKLTAEDYKTFSELLALDSKDKENYITAAKQLSTEQNKIWSDTTLTQEQKNTKIAQLQRDFTYSKSGMAGSYRDVLGVKVGGLSDYDVAASQGNISEQAKPYVETAFQRIREGMANALDPKNQSEAFKKLSPEEQNKIIEAAKNLPLATQAYYNSAIADGTITDTERKLLEQYSGADAARIASIIAGATLPTQEQMDEAYKPYVDGTATVTAASNITGVVAPSWLSGLSNIVTQVGIQNGQEYANGFVLGYTTGPDGKKFSLAGVTVTDALNADPAVIAANGVKAGESLPEGIWQGIANGTKVLAYKVTKYFGPANSSGEKPLIKVVREALNMNSPSKLYRDQVGLPIILGVAKGIEKNAYLAENALKKALGIDSDLIAAGQGAGSGIGDVGSEGAGKTAQTVSKFFLAGQTAAADFVKGLLNEADPINSFTTKIHTAIQSVFDPTSSESNMALTNEKIFDFGKHVAAKTIAGFAYVLDGKQENAFTIATTLSQNLAITAGDEAQKWTPQAKSLGFNIVQGIADGADGNPALSVAIRRIVRQALLDGQDEAIVESPSKLFAEKLGSPMTAGIAQGVSEGSYMLEGALGGLMDSATTNYRPDISPAALAGRRQAEINANNTYNYNLGVHTSQNPQLVERSFAVMQSFRGE